MFLLLSYLLSKDKHLSDQLEKLQEQLLLIKMSKSQWHCDISINSDCCFLSLLHKHVESTVFLAGQVWVTIQLLQTTVKIFPKGTCFVGTSFLTLLIPGRLWQESTLENVFFCMDFFFSLFFSVFSFHFLWMFAGLFLYVFSLTDAAVFLLLLFVCLFVFIYIWFLFSFTFLYSLSPLACKETMIIVKFDSNMQQVRGFRIMYILPAHPYFEEMLR